MTQEGEMVVEEEMMYLEGGRKGGREGGREGGVRSSGE